MTGSAFKAFKACVPIEWSPHLYVTLVYGLPGTQKLHHRTLDAMRLHRTVVHRTTPSLLDMINQVKHLIVAVMEEMHIARKAPGGGTSYPLPAHRRLTPPDSDSCGC